MKRALCIVLALAAVGAAGFAQAMIYKEAPALAEQVRAGKIPAVDKRVPKDVFVVTPTDKVGKYGGVWRMAFRPASAWSFWSYVIKENEVRYSMDGKNIVPVLLKSYTASPDNKVYTFTLRQGIKWSDGDPYDADDYLFWWEDIVSNAELTPSKPSQFMAGGKPAKFEKLDQYTVRFTFDTPYATFLPRLAEPRLRVSETGPIAHPSHYLKAFHPKYASKEAVDKAVKDGGFSSWVDMFKAKAGNISNPAIPVLCAWRNIDSNTGAVMRFERNPYYWKVDTAGNQLPYVDTMEMYFYSDAQACLLKALAGEVDFQYREIASLTNYPTLAKGADKGGYRLVPAETLNMNQFTNFLNRTTTDSIKNKLYNDLRFRQALSLAIDRTEINVLIQSGMALVTQVAPPVNAASWEKSTAEMYTQYDVAAANKLLDEVGLRWDAKHEWRLGPDGKPLTFTKIFYQGADVQELIKNTWKKVGINVNNKLLERSLWESTVQGNDWDMSSYAVDTGGGVYSVLGSVGIFPQSASWRPNSQWGLWYGSQGKSGIEPPAEVKKLRALYEEYISTATPQRMVQIEKEAFKTYVSNLLAIGIVSRTEYDIYFVANKKMRNIPPKVVDDTSYCHPAQFFFD